MSGYRHRSKKRMLIAILLVALIACAAAGILVRKVMVVKNIVVEGVDDELAADARTLSGIHLGQSVFDIDEHDIAINLRANGYIKLCSVDVQKPDTVVLKLEKRNAIAAFEHLGFTYIVDSELYVLECVSGLSNSGYTLITGVDIQRTPVGMALNIDTSRGEMIKTLLSTIEKLDLCDTISEINAANSQSIVCETGDGVEFKLGDISSIETKLSWIEPMLKQLKKEGRLSGTVDVSSPTSADYLPPEATATPTARPGQAAATFVPFSATPQPTAGA